jgi:hypothetical protein
MASAVAASQANDLIANGASEPCVANTTTGSCAGAVARAAAGTVRLFARSALPPGVANAVTAALAYSVPAAVVKFLARHHLAAVQPSEPQSTAGAVVGSPNLFERVRICVADLVHWPQSQAHRKHGNGKTDGEWLHIMPSPRVHFSAAMRRPYTAPAPVFKGLPSLLAMSRLFNALPTADAILVSTSADAILVSAVPRSSGV